MDRSEQSLRAAARGAYERGRLTGSLARALPVPFLALLSLTDSHEVALTVSVAAVAFASMVAFEFRGGALGVGARWGLITGLLPFSASVLGRPLPHFVMGGHHVHGCVLVCAAACVAMTLLLARVTRQHRRPTAAWLAGTWVMVTIGATACACVGVGGVAVLVGGVVIASLPVAALGRRWAAA